MNPAVEWPAVARGAALALAVAVPTIVAAEAIDAIVDIGPDSNVVFVFFAAVIAGFVLDGWQAGRRQPDAPLTHWAVAAVAAYLVLAVATSTVRLVTGDVVHPVGLVFYALMAASSGTLGGLVASRRSHRRSSELPQGG